MCLPSLLYSTSSSSIFYLFHNLSFSSHLPFLSFFFSLRYLHIIYLNLIYHSPLLPISTFQSFIIISPAPSITPPFPARIKIQKQSTITAQPFAPARAPAAVTRAAATIREPNSNFRSAPATSGRRPAAAAYLHRPRLPCSSYYLRVPLCSFKSQYLLQERLIP